jgi:alcohol dehydrogenase class IV
MKRTIEKEMLPEYDFSRGVRGKYVARLAEGSNVVVLDPDVQRMFPDSAAVNAALRALGKAVEAAHLPSGLTPRRSTRTRAKAARVG